MNVKSKEKIKFYLQEIKKVIIQEAYPNIFERDYYENMLNNLNGFIDEETEQIEFMKKQKEFYL